MKSLIILIALISFNSFAATGDGTQGGLEFYEQCIYEFIMENDDNTHGTEATGDGTQGGLEATGDGTQGSNSSNDETQLYELAVLKCSIYQNR